MEKRNSSKGKKIFKLIAALIGAVILVCAIGLLAVIISADRIDPSNIYDMIEQNTVIYDDEGEQIDEVYYSQNRVIVKYEELPPELVNAIVAIEDKTFWEHHGVNWIRVFGAIAERLKGGGEISGTSTITQQLARNVYLPEIKGVRSIRRKIIEVYYAFVIERHLSKEEIIEAYLNSVYFGYGSYGVGAAAETYFSKTVDKLSLTECAALAALPQMPDTYALIKSVQDSEINEHTYFVNSDDGTYVINDDSRDRRDLCLDLMLEQGYIDKERHDSAYDVPARDFVKPHFYEADPKYAFFTDYLLAQVKDDLAEQYGLTSSEAEKMVYSGGLRIHSTLDKTAQDVIVKEFADSSNYPQLIDMDYDEDGNILASDGSVMLYNYDRYFTGAGEFTFEDGEAEFNKDGSLIVKRGRRLNIYTNEVDGGEDYSIEFKSTYQREDGQLYIYQGGYVAVPAAYKSIDEDGNVIISADYFSDHPGRVVTFGGDIVLEPEICVIPARQIQPQSACAIVQVGTGEVKALVGGRGSSGRYVYNRALNPRQPGSSIKPLSVYGAALQRSYEYAAAGETFPFVDYGHDTQGTRYYGDYLTEGSIIIDEPMKFGGEIWPYNVDNAFRGRVTMKEAIRQSLNTCAVKIEMQIGNEYSAEMLKKFGLTTIETEDPEVNDLNAAALALGGLTRGVIPLEMAQAYAAFPNSGVRMESVAYTTIEDIDGNVILTAAPERVEVLDEGVAMIMTDMLENIVTSGYASAAQLEGVQSAGKSGTTNDNYDIWFDGFTPNYACVVWIGNDVNISLSTMSYMSVRMWGRIMDQIPKARGGGFMPIADDVVKKNGFFYTEGTEPK